MPDGGEAGKDPQAATEAAYRRGLAEASTAAQIEANRLSVVDLRQDLDDAIRTVRELTASVQKLVNEQEQQKAVQSALAQSVKDTSDKQLSTRTFVLGLVGFLIALAALLFGGGGIVHGSTGVIVGHVVDLHALTSWHGVLSVITGAARS